MAQESNCAEYKELKRIHCEISDLCKKAYDIGNTLLDDGDSIEEYEEGLRFKEGGECISSDDLSWCMNEYDQMRDMLGDYLGDFESLYEDLDLICGHIEKAEDYDEPVEYYR
jgi:hypothetical protein